MHARIDALDRDFVFDDVLGSAEADAEGTFSVEIPDDLYGDLLTRQAIAYFRVYRDGRLILDTRGSTTWSPGTEGEILLELPDEAALRGQGHVGGRVVGADGAPVPCARVALVEKRLREERVLSEARANRDGEFQFVYPRPACDAAPHLLVRATGDGRVLGESEVVFRAPAEVTIDLRVTGSEAGRLFEAARTLEGSLDGVAISDLDDADIAFVARAAGIDEAAVRVRREAARFSAGNAVDHDAVLRISALSAGRVEAYLDASPSGLAERLGSDRERGALPLSDGELAVLAARANEAANALSLDVIVPGARGSARDLLAPLELSESELGVLAQAYAASEDPILALRADSTLRGRTDEIEDALELGVITRAHAPLTRLLWQSRGRRWQRARDLASWSSEDLLAVVREVDALPDDLEGESVESRAASFAADIDGQLDRLFPTARLAARMPRETDAQRELADLLSASPDLDLASDDARTFFASDDRIPDSDQGRALVERVVSAQQLYRLTGSTADTSMLMRKGIDTAHKLARADKPKLLESFGNASADWVESAKALSTMDLQIAASAQLSLHERVAKAVYTPSAKTLPNLKTLFGSQGGCPCSHCQSVLGPSAYFVDLLDFLGPGAAVLFARRPDLQEIELTCENTHTELKTIDLVNEILERCALGVFNPFPQTRWSKEELDAQPEHVLGAAYDKTGTERSPWTLPFHEPSAKGRLYLAALGIDRVALTRAFAPDHGAWPDAARRAVAAEQLGLMPGDDLSGFTPLGSPVRLAEIARRAELDLQVTRALVGDPFVRGSSTVELRFPQDPCDLHTAEVHGLDAAASLRLFRAVRLHHTTDRPLAEIVDGLATFDLPDFSRTTEALGQALEIARTLRVSLSEVLRLVRPLRTVMSPGAVSEYDQAFRSRTVVGTVGSHPLDPSVLSGQSLASLRAPLAAALAVTHGDLLIIEAAASTLGIVTPFADAPAGVAALSRCRAVVELARMLRSSVLAVAQTAELLGMNPFESTGASAVFLDNWGQISRSKLTLTELDWLVRGTDVRSAPEQSRARDGLVQSVVAAVGALEAGEIHPDAALRAKDKLHAAAEALGGKLGLAILLVEAVIAASGSSALASWISGLGPASSAPVGAQRQAVDSALAQLERLAVLGRSVSLRAEELAELSGAGFVLAEVDGSPLNAGRKLALLLDFVEIARHREVTNVAFPRLAGGTLASLSEWAGFRAHERALLPETLDASHALHTAAHLVRLVNVLATSGLTLSTARAAALPVRDSTVSAGYSAEVARAIRDAVRSHRGATGFRAIATPIEDRLRIARRDALRAYLLRPSGGRSSASALFNELLVDIEVTAAPVTSRIKLAITTVQMFVERALMGLEPTVGPPLFDALQAKRWNESLSRYRVWEANRRIFLHPENWIEPELRADKTPLFRDLEQALAQNDLTEQIALAAYRRYLEELDGIARLEVVAMHDSRPDTSLRPSVTEGHPGMLHFIARTRSEPHRWFWRARDKATLRYTAWEPIELDISGDWVMPVLRHGRLQLLWLTMTEKTEEPRRLPKRDEDPEEPKRYLEVKLCWSEKQGDRWLPKRTSKRGLTCDLALLGRPAFPSEGFASLRSQLACRARVQERGDLSVDVYLRREHAVDRWLSGLGRFTVSSCQAGAIDVDQPTIALSSSVSMSDWPGTFENNHLSFHGTADLLWLGLSNVVLDHPASHSNWRTIQATDGERLPALGRGFELFYPFIYDDRERTMLAHPVYLPTPQKDRSGAPAKWSISGAKRGTKKRLSSTVTGVRANLAKRASSPIEGYPAVRFETFHHPHACTFLKLLLEDGLDGLFALPTQFLQHPSSQAGYGPNKELVDVARWPSDDVDFSSGGAYSIYNWELFFHAPLLIAAKLARAQRYREALSWYRRVFDPSASSVKDPRTGAASHPPQRYWRFRPFFDATGIPTSVGKLLAALEGSASGEDLAELQRQLQAWAADPFDPHAIASLRHVAYQMATVQGVLDTLIGWGDQLFRQDTLESVQEAALLYLLAAELLGDRPASAAASEPASPTTYRALRNAAQEPPTTATIGAAGPIGSSGAFDVLRSLNVSVFCLPLNDKLLGYWDTVDDRLFKLRHSLNLDGALRRLALFEPPIDPALLVRSRAAGLDLATVASAQQAPLAAYRFSYLIQKALELAGDVRGLGASLLAALEKRDAEALAALRATNEVAVLHAVRAVKQRQVDEAAKALEPLDRRRALIELRHAYYRDIQKVSTLERMSLLAGTGGIAMSTVGQMMQTAASGLVGSPGVVTGAAGIASPVALVEFGPKDVGEGLVESAKSFQLMGSVAQSMAGQTATTASHERRWEEWKLQERLAEKELEEIDRQRLVAEIRVDVAQRDLTAHERQIESASDTLEVMETKFTRTELFDWMVGRLSATYFQAYDLALAMARRAERAFHFERRDGTATKSESFIASGYWDTLHKGLLAGERLAHDLRRLESAYIDENQREFELTKHLSLAKYDPVALAHLKQKGYCFVAVPATAFDSDQLSEARRRLKHVSMSVPCLTGPYTSVNASLCLIGRATPMAADPWQPPVDQIVTSGALNESGMFEPALRDERYLPFEGASVDSAWFIKLGSEELDVQTITDVVLHVRYTARGSVSLVTPVPAPVPPPRPGTRMLTLKSDFPDLWHKLRNHPPGQRVELPLVLPYAAARCDLVIHARGSVAAPVTGFALREGGLDTPLSFQPLPELGGSLAANVFQSNPAVPSASAGAFRVVVDPTALSAVLRRAEPAGPVIDFDVLLDLGLLLSK